MRLIDADVLLKEFAERARAARNWKENAINNGDEEIAIRADATLAFLTEVKLTIEAAPTVGQIKLLNDSISNIKLLCKSNNDCVHCPMNHNCNEQPAHWEDVK